jgi:hypothetical protein
MELLSFSLTVILAIAMLHITAFWVVRTMYPPPPPAPAPAPTVVFTEPTPIPVIDAEIEVPVQTAPISTEREQSVIIPTDTPVQRDARLDAANP